MGNFLEEASVGILWSSLEVSGLSRGSLGRVGVPKLPQETIRTNIFPKSKTFRFKPMLNMGSFKKCFFFDYERILIPKMPPTSNENV